MDTARSTPVEGVMRALPVARLDKGIEASRLGAQGVGRRGDGRDFQRTVQALVAPVLSRMGGGESFRGECPGVSSTWTSG